MNRANENLGTHEAHIKRLEELRNQHVVDKEKMAKIRAALRNAHI